jgi:hypothetical protein
MECHHLKEKKGFLLSRSQHYQQGDVLPGTRSMAPSKGLNTHIWGKRPTAAELAELYYDYYYLI